ncbi:biotin/lipoate--protein ligase family protein [Siccirubricoccus deserti]
MPSFLSLRGEPAISTTGLPDLPSVFAPVALREGGDALARALALAPERGAGTLAWVRAYARAEAAVVLEPEMPLASARLAFHAAANALADAVAALGPPEVAVQLRWPGVLLVNAGECGRVRLAAPPGTPEDAVPDWLVVAMEARLAFPEGHEPGRDPGRTSLFEEGFSDLDSAALTAAWARHLMAGLDDWQARGPKRLAEHCLARLADAVPGQRRGIDPGTGDLVLERDGLRERQALPA